MGGIKYYQLAKNEELPDEFCAVRDIGGEPSEYTWYERMSDSERELWVPFTQSDWFAGSEYRKLQVNNAKLRELVEDMLSCIEIRAAFGRPPKDEMYETFARRARELGVDDG